MKNKHSKQDEPDMISVFIGTWNMGQAQAGVMVGEGASPGTRGMTHTSYSCCLPSTFRKCTTTKKRDILVHIKGTGEGPG